VQKQQQIVVIGGGAAGFFAAISAANHHPEATVMLLEKSNKLLAKVRVSGGGRCNVTHHCFENRNLAKFYPRGERFLKKAFEHFSVKDTVAWFENRGVALATESDNRMFPSTNTSQTIVDTLIGAALDAGVQIRMNTQVQSLKPQDGTFLVETNSETIQAQKVIIASGGSPKKEGLLWLEKLGHQIENPVPSLFTFNLPKQDITQLMGVSVAKVGVKLQGSKLQSEGPLLITHWGLSGPAILKLSAFGARELADKNYRFHFQVNWLGALKEHDLRSTLDDLLAEVKKRKVSNRNPFDLPSRLWEYLLQRSEIDPDKPWQELSKKAINKLINALLNDVYEANGKTTFKEEFVTAGGVSLEDVDPNTMMSRVVPNLYFAGEVLDIDGVTGGFNFQAAWTTGFVAGVGGLQ
jgi:predicted Rossmann fold flavoprotein